MNDKNELNLQAPILPHIGLGGIKLSAHIQNYKELISSFSWLDFSTLEDQSISLFSPFHIGYELQDTLVMIFDVLTGKLERICVKKEYKGTLFDKIQVGMPIEEAIKMESRLKYDELEEYFYIDGVAGVVIESDASDSYIEVISIHI